MQVYSDSNQALEGTGRPYHNLSVTKDCIVRSFASDIDPEELKWHQDDEDRLITVLECGKGWGEGELVIKIDLNDKRFFQQEEH